jgi:hypothetical protein
MTKPIQAYFQTENETEDVRILLQAFATDLIEVGMIGDEHPEGLRFNMPLGAAIGIHGVKGGGLNNVVVAAVAAGSGTTPVIGDLDKGEELDTKHLHYVLSAKVSDENYEEAVALIHRNKGHVQQLD